jgi:uncharacterized membrane protein YidH (DUF202 family)
MPSGVWSALASMPVPAAESRDATAPHPAIAAADGTTVLNAPRQKTIQEHQLFINEAQLLLSQKRTSLSVLRTGLGIMTLPASVFTILVATSRSYDAVANLVLLLPLALLCVGLVAFGAYLIVKSWQRMKRCDRLLQEIEGRDSLLKELIAD